MESPLSPRESGKFIAEHSKDVFIDQDGVGKFATTLVDKVSQNQFSVAGWKTLHELNPRAMDEEAVNWVFLTDTLNFSFWAENNKHKCLVSYKGKTYSGFWALCAAVNRALDEGIPITSASYYATITLDQLRHVMRSDTNIPMPLMEERLRVLHETGNIMIEKFGGSYLNCVKKSEKSALRLMQMVVENFPSYRDEGTFEGRRVTFYKRVQILVADTWTVLEGKGDGCFSDISEVTMFADYRIPQALVHLRTMRYSEELMKKLKEGLLFQYGDRQEMEIRGCSIWCVELICDRVRAIFKQKGLTMKEEINAILLDHYLWDYARDHREEMKEIPFHHVRCIYY